MRYQNYYKSYVRSLLISKFQIENIMEITKIKNLKLYMDLTNCPKFSLINTLNFFQIISNKFPKIQKKIKNEKILTCNSFLLTLNTLNFLEILINIYLPEQINKAVLLNYSQITQNLVLFFKNIYRKFDIIYIFYGRAYYKILKINIYLFLKFSQNHFNRNLFLLSSMQIPIAKI